MAATKKEPLSIPLSFNSFSVNLSFKSVLQNMYINTWVLVRKFEGN